jgi:hypothetical protein
MQRFDELPIRRRKQLCHQPEVISIVGNSFRTKTKTCVMNSFSVTVFILVTISSLIFYKSDNIVQALQPSASLPPPAILKQLLQSEMDGTLQQNTDSDYDGPILLPCCYDGLTARLIARHEMKSSNPNRNPKQRFQATFMTGFGVSAIHGIPDTQLISYLEMIQSCSIITEALQSVATEQELPHPIPCIAVRMH